MEAQAPKIDCNSETGVVLVRITLPNRPILVSQNTPEDGSVSQNTTSLTKNLSDSNTNAWTFW